MERQEPYSAGKKILCLFALSFHLPKVNIPKYLLTCTFSMSFVLSVCQKSFQIQGLFINGKKGSGGGERESGIGGAY